MEPALRGGGTPVLVALLLVGLCSTCAGGAQQQQQHHRRHQTHRQQSNSYRLLNNRNRGGRTDRTGTAAGSGGGGPYFEHIPYDAQTGEGGRNLTTVEGGRAVLACVIRNLERNSTVSWIRKGRHPVVLSSGGFTFTSDKRVRVTHAPDGGDPDDWQLAIDPVMERDSGLYECQVNTRPDKMSLVFKINVMPARAKLLGESAVFVKAGSTLSLTCEINLYSAPPPDITWYQGTKVLNFDSPRGGISLETEKSRTGTTSKLLVTRAGTRDSGNYTCLPSRGEAVSADVHVITDENPAELQDGLTGSSFTSSTSSSGAPSARNSTPPLATLLSLLSLTLPRQR